VQALPGSRVCKEIPHTASSLPSYYLFSFFFPLFFLSFKVATRGLLRPSAIVGEDEGFLPTNQPPVRRFLPHPFPCILPVRDIIALIHFHCVLASKHKSSRPRKSYGTMPTGASLSPWSECTKCSAVVRVQSIIIGEEHVEPVMVPGCCRNIIARDIASPFSFSH